jgi:hypothetical protein
MRSRNLVCSIVLMSLWICGCGEAQMAPVKGRVMCNGKPVREAAVTFSPVRQSDKDLEPGRPGTGFTDEQGLFVLSTHKNYDGAQVGEHNVTVVLDDTNPAPCKRTLGVKLEVKPGDNEFDLEMNQ